VAVVSTYDACPFAGLRAGGISVAAKVLDLLSPEKGSERGKLADMRKDREEQTMRAQVFEGGLALQRAIQESVLGGGEISKQELRATQESNRILGDIRKGIGDLLSKTKTDAARLVQ
jgi:hypothetical protein